MSLTTVPPSPKEAPWPAPLPGRKGLKQLIVLLSLFLPVFLCHSKAWVPATEQVSVSL